MATPTRQEAQEDYAAAGLALASIQEARKRLSACWAATNNDLRAVNVAEQAIRATRERALSRLHELEKAEIRA